MQVIDCTNGFWGRVDRSSGECWLWTGAVGRDGLGQVKSGGKAISAHRRAFELSHGELPCGLLVIRTCGHALCCNPDHLTAGTAADAARARAARGTVARGERNGRSKLTETAVHQIAARMRAGESQTALAEVYGVDRAVIRRIAQGTAWRSAQ